MAKGNGPSEIIRKKGVAAAKSIIRRRHQYISVQLKATSGVCVMAKYMINNAWHGLNMAARHQHGEMT